MSEPVTFKKSRRERYKVRDDVGLGYKKDTYFRLNCPIKSGRQLIANCRPQVWLGWLESNQHGQSQSLLSYH